MNTNTLSVLANVIVGQLYSIHLVKPISQQQTQILLKFKLKNETLTTNN